jgi:hypothetical protein
VITISPDVMPPRSNGPDLDDARRRSDADVDLR